MADMRRHLRKIAFSSLALISVIGAVFGNYRFASATVVNNNTTGIYSDDFTDASGIAGSANAGVNVADGMVELQNAGGTYAAPYSASGTVTLTLLRPAQVAKWGTLSIVANTPPGTSIKVQAMDDGGNLWRDEYLPGNSTGISSFPVDMGEVPIISCAQQYIPNVSDNYQTCSKNGAIQFEFTLATSDSTVTPAIDSMSFNWLLDQGDNSPSALSSSPWPAEGVNEQATYRSPYANQSVYPAIRWASAKFNGDFLIDSLFVVNGYLFGWSSYPGGWMFGMNKDTGEVTWRIPFSRGAGTNGAVSENGVFYGTDFGNDQFYAVDTTNGQIRWTYQFYGGHGSGETAIGPDGTIYTIRGETGDNLTVYAFNADGTVKWTKLIPPVGNPAGSSAFGENISIDPSGNIVFGYYVIDASGNYLNLGKVYELSPAAGDVLWSYNTGDTESFSAPMIESAGTVYVGNYNHGTLIDAKLYAINSDGSLKWAHDFGTGSMGVLRLVQKADGNIFVVLAGATTNSDSQIIEINKDDGTVVQTATIGEQSFNNYTIGDANDGLLVYEDDYAYPTNAFRYDYYDKNLNFKWEINRPFPSQNSLDGIVYGWSTQPVIDERGWAFSSIGFSNYDSASNWVASLDYTQVFAMAPWTLTPSTSSATIIPGGTVNFSVTTSMQQTNPLTDRANNMQVVLDTGDKVPLAYSSTDSDGDTIWTGSYVIPAVMALGNHVYTVQANADMVKTDMAVNFAFPAIGSDNTGLTATGSFNVQAYQAPSGGGGGSVPSFSIGLSAPHGGETYAAGQQVDVNWSPTSGTFVNYRVSYSSDNGSTWSVLATVPGTSYTWTVPLTSTPHGLIKVEGLDSNGYVLALATNTSAFTIIGVAAPPASSGEGGGGSPPPPLPVPKSGDPTVAGAYDKGTAAANNPDINTDLGLTALASPPCVSGTLIKSASLPAVYYCGADGKRYVFVNAPAYFSWYPDFSTVKTVSAAALANIMIGGNVTYRPGTRMVKIQSDPKVYVVARGGVLRWVEMEAAAIRLFGTNWNKMIDDISDSFFVNYHIGAPITQ
jgi:outer membrane protein assembly factor BamB